FVDQKHPSACDTNAGVEAAPFKTIQPAVNQAKPGDTIWVKEGFYEDPARISSQGRRTAPITLAVWKDDRVCMGSEPKPLPAKDVWKKMEGTKSWQVIMPEGTPDDIIVLFNGKAQPCQLLDTPPKDSQVLWSTYRKADRMLMVNAGGPNPAERNELILARNREAFIHLDMDSAHWIVRGFEFGYAKNFIINYGYNHIIEDCFFHHTYLRAIFGTGYLCTVRRCTFDDSGLHGSAGAGSVFEDNIFYRGDRAWDEDIDHRVMELQEPSGGIGFKGIGYGITFRHNFCDEATFWPDGDGTGTRVYGNAFHDNRGYAIYNEAADDDTLIIGNYMGNTQAGVASSWCSRLTVLDNFIEGPGSGIILHNRDKWPLRYSFMTIRGNAIVGSPLPLSGYGGGYENAPEGWANCLVDFNHYRIKAEGGAILDLNGKVRCKTIEEMRKLLGWDLHGEAKPYDPEKNDLTPESLGGGTVTVRLPIGANGWKSRPMLADPGITGKFPAAPRFIHTTIPAFFWRIADGNCDPKILNQCGVEFVYENLWWPAASAGYNEGEVRGCAWYVGADPIPETPDLTWTWLLDVTKGNKFLVVAGKTPDK
ncbi:MAG: right-handed parallel beta-helix repeat-containing protein, partial [candidate division NC10 bacterium]